MSQVFAALAMLLISTQAVAQATIKRWPIIDMHIHAEPLSEFGGGQLAACSGDQRLIMQAIDPRAPARPQDLMSCPKPIKASATDAKVMSETLEMLRRYNIRRAITMGSLEDVTTWAGVGGSGIITGLNFSDRGTPPDEYRRLFAAGRFKMFGEIGLQYRGLRPSDPALEPYFALAEELDIPVGIHMGEGPPGGAHVLGPATYRVALGSPLLLEELILRHPKLRLYVMHYGSPFVDEMIAMMYSHPNLYVDIAANDWGFPRRQFYRALEQMIDAGFEKRIMFGSDQMVWPAAIGKAVETVASAPFLSQSQKRDIFYNNAARFLRLSQEEIARDHARDPADIARAARR